MILHAKTYIRMVYNNIAEILNYWRHLYKNPNYVLKQNERLGHVTFNMKLTCLIKEKASSQLDNDDPLVDLLMKKST